MGGRVGVQTQAISVEESLGVHQWCNHMSDEHRIPEFSPEAHTALSSPTQCFSFPHLRGALPGLPPKPKYVQGLRLHVPMQGPA